MDDFKCRVTNCVLCCIVSVTDYENNLKMLVLFSILSNKNCTTCIIEVFSTRRMSEERYIPTDYELSTTVLKSRFIIITMQLLILII